MPVAGGGFEQCYNAQAVVAAESLLVVAAVVQAPNDKQQIEPMLERLEALPEASASRKRCSPTPAISARPTSNSVRRPRSNR